MADPPDRADDAEIPSRPEWFGAFLADRGTRKPSMRTMKAYRQDFDAIATLIAGGDAEELSRMSLCDITTDTMRTAFAQYAETHEASTIQRCWSTWNVLCTFLYTSELIAANPMSALSVLHHAGNLITHGANKIRMALEPIGLELLGGELRPR